MRILVLFVVCCMSFGCKNLTHWSLKPYTPFSICFKNFHKTYKQGFITLDAMVKNNENEGIYLTGICTCHTPANFVLTIKDEHDKEYDLRTTCTLSRALCFNNTWRFDPKQEREFNLLYICELVPGKYKIRIALNSDMNCKSEWYFIEVKKGEVIPPLHK